MPDELDQMLSTVENCWDVARRRRWWILLSALLMWGAVWGISWLLPRTYQSEATILLEQQNVPNQYVVPNVSTSVQDRLQTLSQQVLSRTRLEATIKRFHLYPDRHGLRALLPSGDQVEHMRKDIEIELVPAPGHSDEFTAFKMRYTANSPELAQQVNGELTLPFVNENVEAQQQLSEDTTHFLENELADARTKMEEQEAKVAAFKAKHIGELSGLSEGNAQQILAGIQAQLQNSRQALDSARQRKVNLESLLQQNQTAAASPGSGVSGNGTASAASDSTMGQGKASDKELRDLRGRLQDLQERYTEDYPDVIALKDKIAKKEQLKERAENEMAANSSSRKRASSGDPATIEEGPNGSPAQLLRLENELKANQLEIQNYQKRANDLESQISAYLARLSMAPEAEQELTSISRGYEESKTNYNSLLQKQMQSQLATSLEQRQKGEQFRILDPPSLPNKSLSPNHFKYSLGGLALGIGLGLGVVVVLEITDIRVRNEKDLKALVPALMLVSIPRLNTPKEQDVHAMTRWLDLCGVTIVVALIALGNVYAFFKS